MDGWMTGRFPQSMQISSLPCWQTAPLLHKQPTTTCVCPQEPVSAKMSELFPNLREGAGTFLGTKPQNGQGGLLPLTYMYETEQQSQARNGTLTLHQTPASLIRQSLDKFGWNLWVLNHVKSVIDSTHDQSINRARPTVRHVNVSITCSNYSTGLGDHCWWLDELSEASGSIYPICYLPTVFNTKRQKANKNENRLQSKTASSTVELFWS